MADIEQVLDALERSNLVPALFVARLRMEVAKSPPPHDPKALVKFLVDKGHITVAQGERLLLAPKTVVPQAPASPVESPAPAAPAINLDEDLGLAPLDDEPPPRPSSLTPRPGGAPAGVAAASKLKSVPIPPPPVKPAPTAAVVDELEVVEDEELTEANVVEERLAALSGAPAPRADRKERRNVWDSPFLVLGGGALVLLLIIGGGIVWSLQRSKGEDALALAVRDYKAGSYSQAIADIDTYLEEHPHHKDVSWARVMRGLATIRKSIGANQDWTQALDATKKTLPTISGEEAFGKARAELAGLLPDIADGLARQAESHPDQNLIEQTKEALALVDLHVPPVQRNAQKLSDIVASLDVTARTLARDVRLRETLSLLDKSAGNLATDVPTLRDQLNAAYDARKQLIKDYPKLAADEQLRAAIARFSQAEARAVSAFSDSRDAATSETAWPIRSTLALAARRSGNDVGAATTVAYALARGALFGVNAVTGEPLWRRSLGEDSYLPPAPLLGNDANDALVADPTRKELLRIEAATGKLRWRQTFEDAFDAAPALFGEEALLATRSGKLYRVELASGRVVGGWQLPHALRVAPAVDFRKRLVYQLADHSNLYVLTTQEPPCREVLYLGHEAGSILVAPTAVNRYLFVAENVGLNDSTLRVVQADDAGLQLAEAQSEALGGHVDVAPIVDGRMLHAATDRGGLYSFEVGLPGKGQPLVRVAERAGAAEQPLTHYPLVKDGRFWVAGAQLTRFGIQSASGKLAPDGISLERSVFQQPPLAVGDTLVLVRRPESGMGLSILAVQTADARVAWETTLATPLLGGIELDADGQTMSVLDAAGNVFRLSPSELGRGGMATNARPVTGWSDTIALADLAQAPNRLADGTLVYAISSDPDRLLLVGLDGTARWLPLQSAWTSAPRAFQGGIAYASAEGRIQVVDAATGVDTLEPFQPRLTVDDVFRWLGPTVVNTDQLVAADDSGKVYLLGAKSAPKRHLAVVQEGLLAAPLVSAPMVVDDKLYATNSADEFVAVALASLEEVGKWPLGGKPAWGPARVGSAVMIVTARNELWCWHGNVEQPWKLPLAHGPLAGAPLPLSDGYLLVTKQGAVIRLSADGAEQTHADTGQMLMGDAIVVGQHIVAPGSDGALHVVPLP